MTIKLFSLSQVAWYKTMQDAFAQRGLDLDTLMAESGMALSDPQEVDLGRVSDGFNRAWELAVQKTGDASVGLTKPSHPLAAFGVISHLMLSAADVLGAASSLARFSTMISPTFSMELNVHGERCDISFEVFPGRLPVLMQRYDFLATVFLEGAFWVTGRRLRPLALNHPFPEPPDAQRWVQAYGCPVRFGADQFRAEFTTQELRIPIPTADPTVADLCARMSSEVLQEQSGCVTAKVRQIIIRDLAKGDPRREFVAEALYMSERTLQRRLKDEGTSFADLVDSIRRDLAQHHLTQGRLCPSEMAFQLGFSDPSNFYRACKRWFGQSLTALRTTRQP